MSPGSGSASAAESRAIPIASFPQVLEEAPLYNAVPRGWGTVEPRACPHHNVASCSQQVVGACPKVTFLAQDTARGQQMFIHSTESNQQTGMTFISEEKDSSSFAPRDLVFCFDASPQAE